MTQRRYRFVLAGEILVDDTTVKTALLGFQPEPVRRAPELTVEERLAISQELLSYLETLDPATRLRAYLAGGPLDHERFRRQVGVDMPRAELELEPVTVVERGACSS